MTTPRHRVTALNDKTLALCEEAERKDRAGFGAAALALEDQAVACENEARLIAEQSGDEWLMSVWAQR